MKNRADGPLVVLVKLHTHFRGAAVQHLCNDVLDADSDLGAQHRTVQLSLVNEHNTARWLIRYTMHAHACCNLRCPRPATRALLLLVAVPLVLGSASCSSISYESCSATALPRCSSRCPPSCPSSCKGNGPSPFSSTPYLLRPFLTPLG